MYNWENKRSIALRQRLHKQKFFTNQPEIAVFPIALLIARDIGQDTWNDQYRWLNGLFLGIEPDFQRAEKDYRLY
ncbi:MAG TPA: hypothetical protein PK530_22545 [Anaerolineales bacterium]|nr:hypothetical protein [Anaerolineales bacterium]